MEIGERALIDFCEHPSPPPLPPASLLAAPQVTAQRLFCQFSEKMRGFSNWEFRTKRTDQLPPSPSSPEHPPPSQPSLQAPLPAALRRSSDTQ